MRDRVGMNYGLFFGLFCVFYVAFVIKKKRKEKGLKAKA